MTKYSLIVALLFLVMSCKEKQSRQTHSNEIKKQNRFNIYSKEVSDSFSVFIKLPNDYYETKNIKYPVVYLLDANLYFDILATTISKYSDVGLSPAVILVGIGYKDFPTMDSLRNRDDTYPKALSEYEMSVSGGADKFLSFINKELLPKIDKDYKTDTTKRVLMGHSLGGYFTGYAILQDLQGNSRKFNTYIAASPSIHYNKYWLLNQWENIPSQKNRQRKISIYLTYGGQENEESKTDSSIMTQTDLTNQLSNIFSVKQSNYITYKCDIFSNLGHMDTQILTFVKGLQETLIEEKK